MSLRQRWLLDGIYQCIGSTLYTKYTADNGDFAQIGTAKCGFLDSNSVSNIYGTFKSPSSAYDYVSYYMKKDNGIHCYDLSTDTTSRLNSPYFTYDAYYPGLELTVSWWMRPSSAGLTTGIYANIIVADRITITISFAYNSTPGYTTISVTSDTALLLGRNYTIPNSDFDKWAFYTTTLRLGTSSISAKYYRNGSLKEQRDLSGAFGYTYLTNGTVSGSVLSASMSSGSGSVGYCKDIRVYDTVLSPSDIFNIYAEGLSIDIPIYTHPVSVSKFVGDTALFSFSTTGIYGITGSTLSYQWYKNDNTIVGQTGVTGSVSNVQISDTSSTVKAKIYYSGETAIAGVYTNNATLTVVGSSVINQPQAILQYVGTTGTWTAGVTGGTKQYQWFVGTTGVPGATGITYSRLLTMSDDGLNAKLRVYNNTLSSYTDSTNALIDVVATFGMTGPSDSYTKSGNNANYVPTITGEPLRYQWGKNDDGVTGAIAGATGASYTFGVTGTDGGNRYYVDVSDPIATYRSYAALLTVGGSMVPISPVSIYYYKGETGIFTDGVTGGIGPYTYQWQRKDI